MLAHKTEVEYSTLEGKGRQHFPSTYHVPAPSKDFTIIALFSSISNGQTRIYISSLIPSKQTQGAERERVASREGRCLSQQG